MTAMETALRGTLLVFGISVIGISLCHIVFGPSVIPGSVPVNATMDSEDRFYAVFFLAYGVAVLWCLMDWPSRLPQMQMLMALFFIAGLTRLVSAAVVGLPHPFFVVMTTIEFLLPPLVIWLSTRAMRLHTAKSAQQSSPPSVTISQQAV
jgi:hypothetical protein